MHPQTLHRSRFSILLFVGTLSIVTAMTTLIETSSVSAAGAAKKSKVAATAAEATARDK